MGNILETYAAALRRRRIRREVTLEYRKEQRRQWVEAIQYQRKMQEAIDADTELH